MSHHHATKVALYRSLKSSISPQGIKQLYSLLYTTQHSPFESRHNLASLDFDRHSFFLLQNYYEVSYAGFSRLLEEYVMDFMAPQEVEVDEEKVRQYVAMMRERHRAAIGTGAKAHGAESAVSLASTSSNLNSSEYPSPAKITMDVWNDSLKNSSTVNKMQQYPVPGKVLFHRMMHIARHSVQEQSIFTPQNVERVPTSDRARFFHQNMTNLARIWRHINEELKLEKSEEKNRTFLHYQVAPVLKEYETKGDEDDADTLSPDEKPSQSALRSRISLYPVREQVLIKAYIMDLANIDTPQKLLSSFMNRLNKRHILDTNIKEQLEQIQVESFEDVNAVLVALLDGSKMDPLRMQKFSSLAFTKTSASMLRSYEHCPWTFAFRYLFRLRFPDSTGSFSGNVLHDAQDTYQQIKQRAKKSGERVDHEKLKSEATETAMGALEKKAAVAPKKIRKSIEESKKRLEEDLENVFENENKAQTELDQQLAKGNIEKLPEVVTEKKFNVQFDGLTLVGTMDRIETHFPANEEPYVIISEFKRSLNKKQAPRTHVQLMIYAIAHEILTGAAPRKIVLESPKVRKEFEVTNQWMLKAKHFIRTKMMQINAQNLTAKPNHFGCMHCEARAICPSSNFEYTRSGLSKVEKDIKRIAKMEDTKAHAEEQSTPVESEQKDASQAPPSVDASTPVKPLAQKADKQNPSADLTPTTNTTHSTVEAKVNQPIVQHMDNMTRIALDSTREKSDVPRVLVTSMPFTTKQPAVVLDKMSKFLLSMEEEDSGAQK
eukprot:CAMPEP_0117443432 /NCGR_PEP_ID=MMETSP0759-20121206/4691_1 /TAXON_ID=63605 /ORGANISM="Percolomonas cosmopolitus, Strain WS" /LENGTH=773 /DNA_ID=CAMNT_0005235405 /DNA_START=53 /DNA_END=2374 /DNA_ORIENTATION=+